MVVSLHLERVQPVDGIFGLSVLWQQLDAVPAIKQIEQQPRVVGGLCLAQVNHLVVSQRTLFVFKFFGILFCRGDNGAKECKCRIALAQPETVANHWHVLNAALRECQKMESMQYGLSIILAANLNKKSELGKWIA